mmetsp:Transcript_50982/g.165043  ORF Transcript_50982/g.165043 Transcript_50982/m.165043 type:complete len:227 (-) Transcript_50982:556-1236(-)
MLRLVDPEADTCEDERTDCETHHGLAGAFGRRSCCGSYGSHHGHPCPHRLRQRRGSRRGSRRKRRRRRSRRRRRELELGPQVLVTEVPGTGDHIDSRACSLALCTHGLCQVRARALQIASIIGPKAEVKAYGVAGAEVHARTPSGRQYPGRSGHRPRNVVVADDGAVGWWRLRGRCEGSRRLGRGGLGCVGHYHRGSDHHRACRRGLSDRLCCRRHQRNGHRGCRR